MFEDPDFPSTPPPEENVVKPMSIVGAAMWATGAQIVFLWVVSLVAVLKRGDGYDLIGLVLSQVVAYLFVLYLVLRVHAPRSSIRELLGARGANPWFYPLALVIGASATFPAWWLLEQIERVFPRDEQLFEWLDVFYTLSQPERLAVAFGTVVIGPFMEEMLFRGALYRPLRVDKRPVVVIIVTALAFAAVHLDLHKLPPLFLMGLALGYLRWASGSLLPPFLLHMAFNAVPFVEFLQHTDKPEPDGEGLPLSWVAGGAGLVVLALLFTQALASSTKRQRSASDQDS